MQRQENQAIEQIAAGMDVNLVSDRREVSAHLRCPICYEGEQNGIGVQYSSYPLKKTKYFRCDKCGHTWSAVVELVVTQIDFRIPTDISER